MTEHIANAHQCLGKIDPKWNPNLQKVGGQKWFAKSIVIQSESWWAKVVRIQTRYKQWHRASQI